MADETSGANAATPPVSPATATPSAGTPGPTIHIGEEFGTAKRNLPPAKIVAATLAGVLVIVGIYVLTTKSKPQGTGSLDNIAAIAIPGQTATMVALTFTLRNPTDKILYVHTLEGKLKTAGTDSSAEAVSAVDFDRYFQAFPTLKYGAQPALTPETKIHPGESVTRTIIVAFPVALDAFNQRQSVSVVIWPYDQQIPVVLAR
jgi:hypothetical protein